MTRISNGKLYTRARPDHGMVEVELTYTDEATSLRHGITATFNAPHFTRRNLAILLEQIAESLKGEANG